jgi:hypothetical protein
MSTTTYGPECRLRLAQKAYIQMLQLHGTTPSTSNVVSILSEINSQLRAKDGGINSENNFWKVSMKRLLCDASETCAKLIKETMDSLKD